MAKLLSFTKAAEALHTTQPAITFQIRQLEEYFNTRLFDRTHSRISLTEAGKRAQEYADRILLLHKEMDNDIRALTGDIQGPLVVGASTTIGEYFIPAVIGDFQRKYHGVKVRLNVANTTGIIQMVENNQIDIGIVEGPVNNKNLHTEMIWDDELVVVCSNRHEFRNLNSISLRKILNQPFIGREEGSGTREVLEDYMKEQNINADELGITMEFGSPESIKNAVAADLGISILSVTTLEKELALGSLCAIPLERPIRRAFSIVYQRQKFRLRAMEEFLEFAREHCATRSTPL